MSNIQLPMSNSQGPSSESRGQRSDVSDPDSPMWIDGETDSDPDFVGSVGPVGPVRPEP
jgi:hypothetical protein